LATANCPECGNKVWEHAPQCPTCGYRKPVPAQPVDYQPHPDVKPTRFTAGAIIAYRIVMGVAAGFALIGTISALTLLARNGAELWSFMPAAAWGTIFAVMFWFRPRRPSAPPSP
jgi:hypothetical protein